jgi:hypothetical protein
MASIEFESFIRDVLESATKRFIASVLGDIEAFSGERNAEVRRVVLDTANRSKRAIYTGITGTPVESAHEE